MNQGKANGEAPSIKGESSGADQSSSAGELKPGQETSSVGKKEREGILDKFAEPYRLAALVVLCAESILLCLIPKVAGTDLTLLLVIIGVLTVTLVLVLPRAIRPELKPSKGSPQMPIGAIVLICLLICGLGWLGFSYISKNNEMLKKQNEIERFAYTHVPREKAEQITRDNQEANAALSIAKASLAETQSKLTDLGATHAKTEKELDGTKRDLQRSQSNAVELDDKLTAEILEAQAFEKKLEASNKENIELKQAIAKGLPPEQKQMFESMQTEYAQLKEKAESQAQRIVEQDKFSEPLKKAGLLGIYEKSNDFLGQLGAVAGNAKNEIDFFGVNFHITANNRRDQLIDLLRNGKNLRFLVMDPYHPNLEQLASDFGQPVEVLRDECKLGLTALQKLAEAWKQLEPGVPNPGRLEVQVCAWVPRCRLYIFDEFAGGRTYFIPYINGIDSGSSPGFLFQNMSGGMSEVYVRSFKSAWKNSKSLNSALAEGTPPASQVPQPATPSKQEDKLQTQSDQAVDSKEEIVLTTTPLSSSQ